MAHWGYMTTNGPSTWGKDFPIANGERQSPIDIVTTAAEYDSDVLGSNALSTNYTPESEVKLVNNGHSIMCQITKKGVLTGGPLGKDEYRLEQFHLHWGAEDNRGSEHTVDGKMYASELHLVHWNASKYSSFADAVQKPDGLAVLGIFITPGVACNQFKVISDNCGKLKTSGAEMTVDTTLDPTLLLPSNTSDYWTYLGSLTTPPLFESVTWIVFKEPVEYSKEQLLALRNLVDSDGNHMQDNYRPPAALKQRKVKKTFT
ncbi:CAH2-like protein [Mya arenaria]|uniref:Carbonic anhydrase n=2 Tax=Mya arenaria TaxID=6604 RepID=A0ABY7GAG8_MYAAR|nr:carbonic anhydrase 2-like isoform X2 [Mya arenaria]XP_052790567.1 carbonic anhydrase 2-like isoform X2 [Mya arenaria]XP_052790568.1 carbonic anhydrase 2-like isoform X2 [Mya arenaria]XP_052790569.1 carbonic anhydrase 2-like isoform X2 [Mya arenaria]XP_052790570.1 carbonic anhydrase 2-like isoform X2 [Mya arenaria]XP_052790571.1 carbonic anhydrase 2-like isoform X2 [Mya arenaria]XP_052790572.1 carbonic anhydrase 2-like isoform X2 [Mya arenaria]WAR30554.1 CAH2-like protein [Mya arenaria]